MKKENNKLYNYTFYALQLQIQVLPILILYK